MASLGLVKIRKHRRQGFGLPFRQQVLQNFSVLLYPQVQMACGKSHNRFVLSILAGSRFVFSYTTMGEVALDLL